MTNLLLKIFVKNRNDVQNSSVQESVGKMSGVVGLILNILLASAKIIVGAVFSVLSVLADGLNNLTDCGNNIISIISFKLAGKPADKEHPYGHKRIEYIASMIVAFIIMTVAVELAIESVQEIIQLINGTAQSLDFSIWTITTLSVSILVKFWMFVFNRKLSKRYNSELLKASSMDSISDVCATSAVLIAVIVSHFAQINLDGVMGIVVAVFIAVTGINIFKDTINELLGEAPSEQMIKDIQKRIKSFDGVCGIHDLNVHNYGPNSYYASVHVEVDASVNVMESHELMDKIERDFKENTDITLVTHMDPIVIGDQELEGYKSEVQQIVHNLDEHFSIHDFRMTKGPTLTNLIFDLAVHFDTKLTAAQLKDYIQTEINKNHSGVYVIPTVEKQITPDMPKHHK